MDDEIKVGSVIRLALEDLLKPLIGRDITITIDGKNYLAEIQAVDGIHTAPVRIKKVPE